MYSRMVNKLEVIDRGLTQFVDLNEYTKSDSKTLLGIANSQSINYSIVEVSGLVETIVFKWF